jgi:hypothetical protein
MIPSNFTESSQRETAMDGYNSHCPASSQIRFQYLLLFLINRGVVYHILKKRIWLKEATRLGRLLAAPNSTASCSVIRINGSREPNVRIMRRIVNISGVNRCDATL